LDGKVESGKRKNRAKLEATSFVKLGNGTGTGGDCPAPGLSPFSAGASPFCIKQKGQPPCEDWHSVKVDRLKGFRAKAEVLETPTFSLLSSA
jgi:hypothetical protein